MTPLVGDTLFSSVLPSHSLVSVSDPSRALDSPHSLLSEVQINKHSISCAALVTEVPGHCPEQLTKTLIVRLLKMHFFSGFLFENWDPLHLLTIPLFCQYHI